MPRTIREMVAEIQREVRDTELQPARAAEIQVTLTALMGNCHSEIREADAAYAVVLLACLETEEKANRAKIRAEISPEYARKREARDTKELVIELVRSLRHYLRCLQEEMRLSR